MRAKYSLVFILVDLIILSTILIVEIGLQQERLMKILFFLLTVRIVLLSLILFFGFIVRIFLLKDDFKSFLLTVFLGYFILIIVYVNENGFKYWMKTLLYLHVSWEYFGHVFFSYFIAAIITFAVVRIQKY